MVPSDLSSLSALEAALADTPAESAVRWLRENGVVATLVDHPADGVFDRPRATGALAAWMHEAKLERAFVRVLRTKALAVGLGPGEPHAWLELATALVRRADEARHLSRALADQKALLERTLAALDKQGREAVHALGELERRDAAMKAELHRALRFQRAMIAPLPRPRGMVLDAVYLAAEIISADFYDVASMPDSRVRIFVADATGHGIAAGLVTLFVKAEYETHTRTSEDPSALMSTMNRALTRYSALDLRCTALCVDVDANRRVARFASAAHPGPAVARANGVEHHRGGNTFLGLTDEAVFPATDIALDEGDLLVAFTDGLTDASDASGETFGTKRIAAVLEQARSRPERFATTLVAALGDFVGVGRQLADDVTAVASSMRPARTT
jgi:serine phosphatase RsbU (regulator of sigma subunit)